MVLGMRARRASRRASRPWCLAPRLAALALALAVASFAGADALRSPRGVGADPLIDDGGVEAHDPLDPLEARCRADAASLGSFDAATDPAACASSAVGASEDGAPSSRPSARAPPSRATTRAEFLRDRYIVRFRDYRHAREHRAALERVLGPPANARELRDGAAADDAGGGGGVEPGTGRSPPDAALPPGGWAWVERRNKAAALPTDFALVEFASPSADLEEERVSPRDSEGLGGAAVGAASAALAALLAGVAGVKDVRREQKFLRSLAWDASEEEGGRDGRGGGGLQSEAEPSTHGGFGGSRPGRMRTKPTIGAEPKGWLGEPATEDSSSGSDAIRATPGPRRALLRARPPVAEALGADALWARGYSGAGVKTAVFDTGVAPDHAHFRKIVERSNWTHENKLLDQLGHGTFVAGVVASQDAQCPGFAPDAEVYTFKVFTNDQVSYTSWFLDAFNYAIASGVHVINLSIGGPDYLDFPFVEKIDEITANGIIMISAIGNDGPLWGTLNNPADQLDVVGVGGVDYDGKIAPFSSRGMTTHELPNGYGRIKPDVVAYGKDVMGSKIRGGCRSLSGTSVASPVVAGAVTLLASTIEDERRRWSILNPASMKQALVEGATRLDGAGMHEQGAGLINLENSRKILETYRPRASLIPADVDLTAAACPYAWPHCAQPLYHGAMPFMFNATVANGMGVVGWLEAAPEWIPDDAAEEGTTRSSSSGDASRSKIGGAHLDVRFAHSEVLWPWSGYLALYVRVRESAKALQGVASGTVRFAVCSPPGEGEEEIRRSVVEARFAFQIAPTPPRSRRLLWSQYHSVRYPPGYVPRDNLDAKNDILDWHGDHPHTNFHGWFDHLRASGYFVEILGSPLTCFDATDYGALLLVDSEEEFTAEETAKLVADVETRGLSVAVVGEWYNVAQMQSMRFFDDNTHSTWTPVTGGANVPALNELLKPWGLAFGDCILSGTVMLKPGRPIVLASAADVAAAPVGAHVHRAHVTDHAPRDPSEGSEGGGGGNALRGSAKKGEHGERGVAAFYQTKRRDESSSSSAGAGASDETREFHHPGRLALFGDTGCLDSSHQSVECYAFLDDILEYLTLPPPGGGGAEGTAAAERKSSWLTDARTLVADVPFASAKTSRGESPRRRVDVDFAQFSTALGARPGNEGARACGGPNDPLEFHADPTARTYGVVGWSADRANRATANRPVGWREKLEREAEGFARAAEDIFLPANGYGATDKVGEKAEKRRAKSPGEDASRSEPEGGFSDADEGRAAARKDDSLAGGVPTRVNDDDGNPGDENPGFDFGREAGGGRIDFSGAETSFFGAIRGTFAFAFGGEHLPRAAYVAALVAGAFATLAHAAARRARRRRARRTEKTESETGGGGGRRKKRPSATTSRLLARRGALL